MVVDVLFYVLGKHLRSCRDGHGQTMVLGNFQYPLVALRIFFSRVSLLFYFIPSSESSAYLKQIKCILSAVKKYRIFSLVTDTIFIFSL